MFANGARSSGQVARVYAFTTPRRSPTTSALLWSLSSGFTPSHNWTLGHRSNTRLPPHALFARTPARGMAIAAKRKPQADPEMSEEEVLENLHRMLKIEDQLPTDVWNQPIETLGGSVHYSRFRQD